ncbi:unnamed protein product [Cunninghamella blakesleeana]
MYRNHLRDPKGDNFDAINSIRKSIGKESDEILMKLLEKMMLGIKERSIISNIYVSPPCAAIDPLLLRNNQENELIMKIEGIC